MGHRIRTRQKKHLCRDPHSSSVNRLHRNAVCPVCQEFSPFRQELYVISLSCGRGFEDLLNRTSVCRLKTIPYHRVFVTTIQCKGHRTFHICTPTLLLHHFTFMQDFKLYRSINKRGTRQFSQVDRIDLSFGVLFCSRISQHLIRTPVTDRNGSVVEERFIAISHPVGIGP